MSVLWVHVTESRMNEMSRVRVSPAFFSLCLLRHPGPKLKRVLLVFALHGHFHALVRRSGLLDIRKADRGGRRDGKLDEATHAQVAELEEQAGGARKTVVVSWSSG